MMNEYDRYANVIRSIIKHDKNQKYATVNKTTFSCN